MRILKKMILTVTTAAMAVNLSGFTAFASSTEKITSVRLTVTDRLVPGGEVDEDALEITTSSDKYDVGGWEFEDEGFSWESGDVPRVVVTLETDDDYSFSVSKDKVKLKGAPATVYKTKKEDSQTLLVTLDLSPIADRIGAIEYAYLDGKSATWAPAAGAASYELYLYRDGSVVGSKKTTQETTYNFGTAMAKDGTYYYRVRGIGEGQSKEGLFTDSAECQYQAGNALSGQNSTGKTNAQNSQGTGQTGAVMTQGQWIQDTNGWWWKNPDGTWPANKWELINGKQYFFQENGYMATGWIVWNNQIYFLGPDGDLWVNCQTPDGHIVGADGVLIQ